MDVADWLQGLGLADYAPAFRANDIDFDILRELTDEDLSALGVMSVGHRRKLASAIEALRRALPTAPPAGPPARGAAAERRQITIMFCDLVGSTALSSRLDPEDLGAIVAQYRSVVLDEVRNFDGFIANYMGDGVLVYFGYPRAHEDDPERAVRAGLGILAAIGRLQTASGQLQARIGVATGRVVVGDVAGEGAVQEQAAVGETPNLAARLQAIAKPGEMVVSASTRRLLGDLFTLRDLGAHVMKGLPEPVAAWAVERAQAPQNRFEAMRKPVSGPLVGRLAERRALTDLRRQAWQTGGQMLLLAGEPGIGKSRLAAWFCEDSTAGRHRRYRYQCSQYHRDSVLYPFITQLRQVAGLKADESPQTRFRKLMASVGTAVSDAARITPLLAALLEIPLEEPLRLSPAQQRTQTLAAFLDLLAGAAARRPVLLLFEDAHWADATSLELLELVAARIRTLPVLVLVTVRPDFAPAWISEPNVTVLTLDRLDEDSIGAIVRQSARSGELPPDAVRRIVAKSEGIPLFAEELTRTVLESGRLARDSGQALPLLAVPDTLHDLLMARLDNLAWAKEVAQIGAVIGREFPQALLQEVYGKPAALLDSALARLQEAALIFRRGEAPDDVYSFKHALVQDAAYDSLLRSRRKTLHEHIADILSRPCPGGVESEPEIVAQHYGLAGMAGEAVRWWSKASERALLRSAYTEAISHFKNALALIEAVGEQGIDRKLRLKLHIDYGQALIAARGYNAPETRATFVRSFELATLIENPSERFSAYYGLWSGNYVGGDIPGMIEVSTAFLRDVEDRPDAPETGVAHRLYGATCWFRGDFLSGLHHLEQAVAAYDPVRDRPLAFQFGQDVGIAALVYLAFVLWPMGEVDRACQQLERARDIAFNSKQAISIAYIHFYTCLFEGMRRVPELTRPALEALTQITEAHELGFWNRAGAVFQGWLDGRSVDHDRGMAMIRDSLAGYKRTGFGSFLTYVHILQGDVASGPDEIALALDELDEGLREMGPHWLSAEILRMRGELLLRQDPADLAAAEAAFTEALAVARDQRVRSFALRAAVSLAELYGRTGRTGAAVGVLAPALAGFAEGPGFPEVAGANRLLTSLSASA
jgi:class 3 adenylate cyclase/tetratricopeptide (TPR) repeat protein